MPDPQAHPQSDKARRVAFHALVAGLLIMALKFGVFAWTNSLAVLSDALESIINLAAAGMVMYSLRIANRPADRDHPYGHGKVEFMAVGLEGWLILLTGVLITYQAVVRLLPPTMLGWLGMKEQTVRMDSLNLGVWFLGGIAVISAALAAYVWIAGRRYDSPALRADGRHLATDVVSTVGGLGALLLVRYTGKTWVDPLVALVLAGVILYTSWRLLWQSIHGLMDRIDERDEETITRILDDETAKGAIVGYHKVRHRHTGAFHWVDMHLQVDGDLSVRQSHELVSRIEHRIEQALGNANATAHVEPPEAGEGGWKPAAGPAMAEPSTPIGPIEVEGDVPGLVDEDRGGAAAVSPAAPPASAEAPVSADTPQAATGDTYDLAEPERKPTAPAPPPSST